ncbi:ATP-binding protein [Roseateles sp. LYH14W]|uniref:histidine kinase n=2 Tax=Pelomonas parva TaxID=3299032 RepID=A0ABW7F3A6_9BURK
MLRFTPEAFEQRFGAHYLSFYYRYAQAALVLGVLLVSGDFLVDWLATPEVAANWLRLQVALPVLLGGLAYTFLPQARRHWQGVLAGFIVAASLCLFWILLRIDAEGGRGLSSWVGILNFTFLEFYCFIVLGLQFRAALFAGVAILAAFLTTLWWHPNQSSAELAYWSYHVVTLFTLAVGVGWWREFIVRKDFSAQWALEQARAAAEQLAQTKSAFLATMSHEIRTPLNGVLGMNELLMASPLDPEQRGWANAVQVSGRHLLALINDVLDVSRIEAGRLPLEEVAVDLPQVIEDVRLMFAQPAQAKRLTLQMSCAPLPAGVRLLGDPLRLRQVVANLVGNAIKFTSHGGVTVRVQHEGVVAGLAHVRIAVADTGIGIAPEAQGRIFERFSQADGSTTRRFGGTGLGLAICRELAGLMQGHIEVDSQMGRGTRFTVDVKLRVADGSSPSTLDAAEEVPQRLHGTVLLAEDHPVNRAVAIGMLRRLGVAWQVAEDGAAAVELARLHDFDAVLMDCQMPVMDGYAATRAIRAQQGDRARVPIVALTANATPEDEARCRESGMDGFIGKPFTLATLAAALAPWLQAGTDAATAATAPAPLPADRARIDSAVIATLIDLDEAGGSALLREVASGFLAAADTGLAAMDAALAEGRPDAAARLAHTLKSTAGNAGALALSRLFGELERCARNEDLRSARAWLDQSRQEHAQVQTELAELLRELA